MMTAVSSPEVAVANAVAIPEIIRYAQMKARTMATTSIVGAKVLIRMKVESDTESARGQIITPFPLNPTRAVVQTAKG